MVDFAAPNLCGANPDFNKLMSQFDSIKAEIEAGLDANASTLASTLNASLTRLETDLRVMISAMPTLPAVNFQAEVESLGTLSAGSAAYVQKLASIVSQFGSALPDIEAEISKALASGGDICAGLPNLELPSGAEEAIEKAKNSLQALKPAMEEAAQEFSDDDMVDEEAAIYGDSYSRTTLSENLTALEKKIKAEEEMFDRKVKQIEAEIEAEVAAQREEQFPEQETIVL